MSTGREAAPGHHGGRQSSRSSRLWDRACAGSAVWTPPESAAPRPVRWPSGRVGKRLPGRTRPHGPYRSRGHQARARLPVSAPLSHGESDAYALPWCQWRIRRTTCLRHLESRSDRCLWPRRLRWPARSRVRRPPPDSAGRLRRVPPTYNRYVSSPFHTNTSVAIRTAE